MIKLRGIQKFYRTDEVETTALNGVSFDIQNGEFVAIMGPSGCGKSTLLNILGMLDNPDNGEYHFYEHEVAGYSERQRAELRKKSIGFVFQSFNLIDELTVYENVELPLLYLGFDAAYRKQRVHEVLEQMQMMHRRNHFPQQLSGGQQQRLVIARAIAIEPEVLLLDEPCSALDPISTLKVEELIHQLKEQFTILIVTHNMQQAARVSDYTAFMYLGKLIEHTDTNTIFTNPHQKQTEDYITGRFG